MIVDAHSEAGALLPATDRKLQKAVASICYRFIIIIIHKDACHSSSAQPFHKEMFPALSATTRCSDSRKANLKFVRHRRQYMCKKLTEHLTDASCFQCTL